LPAVYHNTLHLTGLAPSACGYQPRFPVKTDAADSRMYCSVSYGLPAIRAERKPGGILEKSG